MTWKVVCRRPGLYLHIVVADTTHTRAHVYYAPDCAILKQLALARDLLS